jgi:hypothetical protein
MLVEGALLLMPLTQAADYRSAHAEHRSRRSEAGAEATVGAPPLPPREGRRFWCSAAACHPPYSPAAAATFA